MPPKCKFTREEIVQAALDMVRAEGMGSITARSLGAKLGTSPKPIFTVFDSMEQLLQETVLAAKEVYTRYALEGLHSDPPFMGVGIQYLKFAREEPKLFQLLFMSEMPEKFDPFTALKTYDDRFGEVVDIIQGGYQVDADNAGRLYRHLWIYTHGTATLMVTKVCQFTDEEIGQMLTEVFVSLLKKGE